MAGVAARCVSASRVPKARSDPGGVARAILPSATCRSPGRRPMIAPVGSVGAGADPDPKRNIGMLQLLAAVGLAAHGLIHLIGFVVPWRLASLEGFPYRTTALNGALELGEAGARLVGLGWLAVAVGFVVAAVGVWQGASWSLPLVAALALISLGLCILGLPEAAAGIVVNLVILAAVVLVVLRIV